MTNYKYLAGLVLLAVVIHQMQSTAQLPDRSRGASDVESFTEPYRTISVAAPESGVVTQVLAREGARVAPGQPLVRLDVDLHEAMLAIARAGAEESGRVKSAQADVAFRWQRVEKIRKLLEMGSAEQAEFDRAAADLAIAEGQLKAAQEAARLKVLEHQRIQVQIDRRTIRSPCAGVVTEVFKEPGEFTAANDPTLMTVVQLDPLVARFRVSQQVASLLNPGMSMEVELADGTVHAAEVDYVSPLVDLDKVEIKLSIPNPGDKLPGGIRCWLRR